MNLVKPPIAFETNNFIIRRLEPRDEKLLFEAASSSINEVFEFLPWCHPEYSLAESKNWLTTIEPAWKNGTSWAFGIFDHLGTTLHGGCGLNKIDEHPVANLGYWIKTTSTGHGIAKEVALHLANFGFERLSLQRIEIIMSVENTASRAVAVSTGASFEGTLRNRLFLHGRSHDAYLYSLIPDDMAQVNKPHQ